jgi:hypothetical protein
VEVSKMKKRRRLLRRVVIATALLVVALPTVAAAHEHLNPVDRLHPGRHAGPGAAWANLVEPLSLRADYYSRLYKACSVDPRDPRLMKPGAQLCHSDQVIAEVPTVHRSLSGPLSQERAYGQHLVPPEGAVRAEGRGPRTARIDQAPASSDRTESEIWWWMLGIVVAAGGAAGLIVGVRRGRPHALS